MLLKQDHILLIQTEKVVFFKKMLRWFFGVFAGHNIPEGQRRTELDK